MLRDFSPTFAAVLTGSPQDTAMASNAGLLPGERREMAADNSSAAVRTWFMRSLPTFEEIQLLIVATLKLSSLQSSKMGFPDWGRKESTCL